MALIILACSKTETEEEPVSTIIQLDYPVGYGQSGDTVTSTVGFGYDATGFSDTLSVRSKILNLNNSDLIYKASLHSAGQGIEISGRSYNELLRTLEYSNLTESTNSFLAHIKSLLKLGLNSNSIDKNCAYAYYSYYLLDKHVHYHLISTEIESELTEEFKTDIKELTPAEIVSKYGTHLIIDVYTGSKIEVLYKCKLNDEYSVDVSELLYKRMNDYFSQVPGLVIGEMNISYSASDEQLIFNSLGFNKKIFGLINATNNNSNKISLNLNDVMSDGTKYQFVKIGNNGLVPLYELVSDRDKRELLKELIDKVISE